MIELITPHNGVKVELHTEIQNKFIRMIETDGIDYANEWLKTIKKNQELAHPVPVKFQWKSDSESYVFEISEDARFDNKRIIKTHETSCEIVNLKIGQQYFWRVNDSAPFYFYTSNIFPRFIKIDGAFNVRDNGGGCIRQGLLYRGSELNGFYNITDEGRRTFCDELGIKTELDLRAEHYGKLDKSPVGKNIQLKQIPYRPYKEIFEEQYKDSICEIMEFLSDERNYPIYYHCMGGADRTGMIAMYLRAIVGENEENIHLDYELTSLSSYAQEFNGNSFRYRTSEYYIEMLNMLAEYAHGESLSVQILCFLDSCGVTKQCIEKIKSILVV